MARFVATWPYLLHRFTTEGEVFRDYEAEEQANPDAYRASLLEEAVRGNGVDQKHGGMAVHQMPGGSVFVDIFTQTAELQRLLQSEALRGRVLAMTSPEKEEFQTMLEYLSRRGSYILTHYSRDDAEALSREYKTAQTHAGTRNTIQHLVNEGSHSEALSEIEKFKRSIPAWWAASEVLQWHGIVLTVPESSESLLTADLLTSEAECYLATGLNLPALESAQNALTLYRDHAAMKYPLNIREAPFLFKSNYLGALVMYARACVLAGRWKDVVAAGQEGLTLEDDQLESQEFLIMGLTALGRKVEATEQQQRLAVLKAYDAAAQRTRQLWCTNTNQMVPFTYHKDLPEYMHSLEPATPHSGFPFESYLVKEFKRVAGEGEAKEKKKEQHIFQSAEELLSKQA